MAINLNMLRYVNTIAKTGSFSEAAKQLYVSQPYLSQCVKSFENEVGVKIFDRSSHPIKVTPAGMCFVEWGRSIEDNEKAVLKRVQKLSGVSQVTLTIVSSPTGNLFILPRHIARLHALVPDCKVVLKTAPSVEARSELLFNRNADVLIDTLPCQLTPELVSKKIADEHILLAVPRSHPLCPQDDDSSPVNLAQFAGSGFISPLSGTMYRDMLPDICARNSFYPNIIVEAPDTPSCCAMAAEGLGVAIVPSSFAAANAFSDRVRFLPIRGEDAGCPIFITYYKNLEQAEAFSAFLKLLEGEE